MLKSKLKTSLEFLKNITTTGAFTETSRNVEVEICRHLPSDRAISIVEFGMGHGNITREILANVHQDSKIYAFEINKEFCDHVSRTIQDDRLIIINDGAENVKKHVQGDITGVIASIPFSFFSKEKAMGIIEDSYDLLEDGAYYSQVLYTKFNFKKFDAVFDDCEMITLPNLLNEYIYHCRKVKEQA